MAIIGGGVAGVLAVVGLIWLVWPSGDGVLATALTQGGDPNAAPIEGDPAIEGAFTMVQTEQSAEAGILAAATPFLDLPKDPMILRFEKSETSVGRSLSGPDTLPVVRVGVPSPERLTLLTDDLVIKETRLITTIPSSREDLAFFQAQRSRGITELTAAPETAPALAEGSGQVIEVSGDDGSWGELIDTGLADAPVTDEAVYVETKIENTTSTVFALREDARQLLFDDIIVVLQTERPLTEVLTANGFPEDAAARITTAALRLLISDEKMPVGGIVAMRVHPDLTGPQLLQMSIYGADGYIGTLVQEGAGRFSTGADPWIEDDLMNRTDNIRSTAVATQDIRLLDALYSAAIRNGLPTTLVGELIVMMSQLHDLDRFAAVGDKMTILYTATPGPEGQGPGQLLFAGINGPSGEMACYVTPDNGPAGFTCYNFDQGSGGGGSGALAGGLIVPVSGTKTSDFGPRMHPILKQLRNHNGVDWAAPTGTPIYAAAAGTVVKAGDGSGYGNVVYIDHAGGLQTRYAHLDRFGEFGRQGAQVNAGDLIGYVGTTGRSTGPHLHFEVYLNGTPINPLGSIGVSAGPGPGPGGGGGGGASDAVEALVNQIIRVESAGNANAANPLSTAVGLGQFIESTWIRMMQAYRPDLVASMSRQELLNLRTNPELSREMVTNLARENEAFLRSKGHQITAGRLYLAHFLGPGGANTALRAAPAQTVLEVMGEGVVNANPFLRGKTIADLQDWADRKMTGAGSAPAVGVSRGPAVIPAEVRAYKDMIDALLKDI